MKRFQGWRPWAFGDVWDRMSPRDRRIAFWSDIAVAGAGCAIIYVLSLLAGGGA